ncbi:MAG: transposase, partial [Syntrophomonadaceae bacterium]|nr:transposase [Syntrophomonadaceae bacterium]
FFRTLKYEDIYINEYVSPRALRKGLQAYIEFYNCERQHQSLGYVRPIDYYRHLLVNKIAS